MPAPAASLGAVDCAGDDANAAGRGDPDADDRHDRNEPAHPEADLVAAVGIVNRTERERADAGADVAAECEHGKDAGGLRAGEDFGELGKLMSDDPGSANLGGDLGWTTADTFVPEFTTVVNESEIGVISEPFRSPFGWHILEVLDRRVYDNTEDLKERNCDQRIRNSKLEEESQLWIQRLRDEAFVDLRV